MSFSEIKSIFVDEDHARHAEELNNHISWRADRDGNVVHVSGKLKSAHGIITADVAGYNWADLIHPQDRESTLAKFTHSIATGDPMNYTNRLLDKRTGRYRWTRVSAHPRYHDDGSIICWYGMTIDIDDTVTMIERQSTLLQELNHRVKNSLATVQSIVLQTFRSLRERDGNNVESYQTFCDKVMERLLILSSAHDLLTQNSWSGTDLEALVEHTLGAVMTMPRFTISGPEIELSPNASLLLAMIFHELGTNAIKYGAWSDDAGMVSIDWHVRGGSVEIVWREIGGPRICQPDHVGFGTKLITKSGLRELSGDTKMNFDPSGLTCYLRVAISEKVKAI